MALDAGPFMRLGTRGSPSWPGFAPETGYVDADWSDQIAKALADGAGHTFAPAAERWARIDVLSTRATSGGSEQDASLASSFCQRPRSLQRSNRLKRVVRGPYSAGIARQRSPSRNRCRMPLITRRSSTRGLPPRCDEGVALLEIGVGMHPA